MASLSKWGALPDVVNVKEAVNLLMALCPEKESALPQIINDALRSDEIQLWCLSDGKWVKEFVGTTITGTQTELYEFGISPPDFLALLEKRGVPIPEELQLLNRSLKPQAALSVGAADGAQQGLTTQEIANVFYDINGWPAERWIKNLSAAKWATPALIGLGEQGGAPSVWQPLALAQLIHARAKGDIEKQRALILLRARFNRQSALAPWRDTFDEFFATFSDAD